MSPDASDEVEAVTSVYQEKITTNALGFFYLLQSTKFSII